MHFSVKANKCEMEIDNDYTCTCKQASIQVQIICVGAFVRACARVCVGACVRVWVGVGGCVCECVCVCLCVSGSTLYVLSSGGSRRGKSGLPAPHPVWL